MIRSRISGLERGGRAASETREHARCDLGERRAREDGRAGAPRAMGAPGLARISMPDRGIDGVLGSETPRAHGERALPISRASMELTKPALLACTSMVSWVRSARVSDWTPPPDRRPAPRSCAPSSAPRSRRAARRAASRGPRGGSWRRARARASRRRARACARRDRRGRGRGGPRSPRASRSRCRRPPERRIHRGEERDDLLPARVPTRTRACASARACGLFMKAPRPTFTSSTRPSMPSASFFERMLTRR